ncbi:hypothetical protein BpHYR1_028538, partial [Brachionus plicatilis]
VAPSIFYQLFTINVILKNKNLPVVYALLPNKSQESYIRFFNLLIANIEVQPHNILSDFEKSIHIAIEHSLPGTRVIGCYFHLVQNLWRHIQLYKLVKTYAADPMIRKSFKFIQSLAFIPKKDVIFCFNKLRELAPVKFKCMLDYFEKYYIGSLKKNSNTIRSIPMFQIHLWNINERILNDCPKTNNSLESWHKQFEIDAKKHQTTYKLIEQFRIEQKNTDVLTIQIQSGDEFKRKNKEVQKDELIKRSLKDFKRDNFEKWAENFILLL